MNLNGDLVLTGRARIAQEERERIDLTTRHGDHQRMLRQLKGRHKTIEAQIVALPAEPETVDFNIMQETLRAADPQLSAAELRRGGDAIAQKREQA